MKRTVASLLIILALGSVAAFAAEPGYLPLAVGNRWSYSGDIVGPDIKEVTEAPDGFIDAYTIRYVISDHSQDLENYWTSGDDGDVFLHGFRRLSPRISYFYDPPLTVVDAPLWPGKTWVSDVLVAETPGGQPVATFTVRYTVTDPEIVMIEGEPKPAYGILEEQLLNTEFMPVPMTPDGLPAEGAKDVIVPHWWVEGVGEARYRSIGIFHLVGYDVADIVGNRDWSWSRVKHAFR